MTQVAKPIDETFAKGVLDAFLQKMHADSSIEWEPSETPDYYVEIDGVRLGVEITQVMDEIAWGDRIVSSRSVESFLCKLTARLDTRAKEVGILSGSYVLSSNMGKNPASLETHVEDVVLDYIRRTQHSQECAL